MSGDAGAKLALDAALARIAARDGAIGAFWHLDEAGAWRAAREADAQPCGGPLRGALVGVKDNVDVAGMPATSGLAAFRDRVAERDARCVARLRMAGVVLLGKLAMQEGALGVTTDTPRLCTNPLREGYTPGGSSGGSGAAVAAGFVALAVGTDTMGSVRIPAACCGVVGLKPTTGLIGRSGVLPLSPSLDHVGMLARTPREAALGIEAMAAPDAADPASRPAPWAWRAIPREVPRDLRIGLPEPVLAAPMEPAQREAFERAAAALRRLGATVAPIAMPGWEPGPTRRAGLLVIEAEAAALHSRLLDDAEAASPAFRAALAYGRDAGTVRLVRAQLRLAEVRAAALRALDGTDALLMPTMPWRAFPHGTPPPPDQADFAALANIAGLPAIAFPWPASDGGLPASVQLLGRPHAEALLTGLAERLMEG